MQHPRTPWSQLIQIESQVLWDEEMQKQESASSCKKTDKSNADVRVTDHAPSTMRIHPVTMNCRELNVTTAAVSLRVNRALQETISELLPHRDTRHPNWPLC